MRDRLLGAFVGLTVVVLLLFGLPRAFIVAERTREAEQRDLARIADTTRGLVQNQLAGGREVGVDDLQALLGPDDGVRVTGPGLDPPLTAGRALDDGVELTATASSTRVDVEVGRSTAAVRRRVVEALTSIALVGLAVLALAVGAAFLIARRMARPFSALAAAADELGRGRFDLALPETRIGEAVAIREALAASASRLHETLRREREFASNASHQLRTPLAGLRVRLEDLTYWPEVPEDVRAELEAGIADVDRLADTVTGMLELSRRGRYGDAEHLDVPDLLRATVTRWADAARREGTTVHLARVDAAAVHAPPGAVAQVLDVLVHNALHHGHGTVTLESAADDGHVRLRVRDEGSGVTSADQARIFERHARGVDSAGEGIGLPLARDVALSLGGRLTVGVGAPTTFELVLPRAP